MQNAPGEHSAILSTFIKLPFIFKTCFVYFKWSLETSFTVVNCKHCHSWDNCIKNFNLGRYIVGYTVGNLVVRRHASVAI